MSQSQLQPQPASLWCMPVPQVGSVFSFAKRTLDVTGALICLVLATPVMLLCAVMIKIVDGGPVFYHQWRVGRNGWLFKLTKLRTMTQTAERNGAQFAQSHDPRILPGCAWMRTSHVDELPQLWNILKGEMSLVGPRPERPEIIETLRHDLPDIEQRLAVAPGLTGLAQIKNGYSCDLDGARRKLDYDLLYLRKLSFVTELYLLVMTVPRFWDRSAH